jgi:hypothetical protein
MTHYKRGLGMIIKDFVELEKYKKYKKITRYIYKYKTYYYLTMLVRLDKHQTTNDILEFLHEHFCDLNNVFQEYDRNNQNYILCEICCKYEEDIYEIEKLLNHKIDSAKYKKVNITNVF